MRSAARLEEHLPRKGWADMSISQPAAFTPPSCLYSYTYAHTQNPTLLSKSESQVDDYPLSYTRSHLPFPPRIVPGAKLCELRLISIMKKLLRKMRF